MTEADIDALLRDMETQVLEEIQAELAELERQEHEQLQLAADMVEQHMQYLQQHTGHGEHDGRRSLTLQGIHAATPVMLFVHNRCVWRARWSHRSCHMGCGVCCCRSWWQRAVPSV